MAYQSASLEANLAAAAGDDAALQAELRQAFVESAQRQLDLLSRARCDGNWTVAAMRIKGLAASFHAQDLLTAADDALACAPGEPVAIRRIETALSEIASATATAQSA